VDEFQNFATDSFATILSEARKYGLNLTVANQYISQMEDTVRDAVFGNVGTMICFRISADDAPILVKQFEPQFEANDLLQMHNRNFVMNMVINGEKAPAFSARTLQLPDPQADNSAMIIANTREKYSAKREDVEKAINELIMPPEELMRKGPGNPRTPQSGAQAKQWPVDSGAKPAASQQPREQSAPRPVAAPAEPNRPKLIIETPEGEAAVAAKSAPVAVQSVPAQASDQPAGDDAPKRKRTRSRRKKPTGGESSAEGQSDQQSTPQPQQQRHEQQPQQSQQQAPRPTRQHEPVATPVPAPAPASAPPRPAQPPKQTNDDSMGLLKIR
jgi:hypothetical protein